MPAAQRKGDANNDGGVILGGVDSVRINNLAVSVDGTSVSPHARKNSHKPTTAGGVGSVKAGGKPINVKGNADTCGHTRQGGSSDVNVG
jgi:uncharacterized Zn-binding protein involved in type VI secretion